MEIVSKSLDDTESIARDFLANLSPRKEGATVVALQGDLGSGKTTFVQQIGRLLGITSPIQSPTFVIEKRFKIKDSRFKNLIHVDAYRLEDGEDLLKLQFGDLLNDPANLIFIEWPENVAGVIPKSARKISFEFLDEGTRKIRLL